MIFANTLSPAKPWQALPALAGFVQIVHVSRGKKNRELESDARGEKFGTISGVGCECWSDGGKKSAQIVAHASGGAVAAVLGEECQASVRPVSGGIVDT
jgi:hypothetical protein